MKLAARLAFLVATTLFAAPVAAQTIPTHPPDELPFGNWKAGADGKPDFSTIVWSRCMTADGAPGRWVATQPAEVLRPAYRVNELAFASTGTQQAPGTPRIVECIGADGAPGIPTPSVPELATIAVGSHIDYPHSVQIVEWDRPSHASVWGIPMVRGARAWSDAGGPVVVTGGSITVFAPSDKLQVGSGTGAVVRRNSTSTTGSPHCVVSVMPEKREIARRDGECTSLSESIVQSLVRTARESRATP